MRGARQRRGAPVSGRQHRWRSRVVVDRRAGGPQGARIGSRPTAWQLTRTRSTNVQPPEETRLGRTGGPADASGVARGVAPGGGPGVEPVAGGRSDGESAASTVGMLRGTGRLAVLGPAGALVSVVRGRARPHDPVDRGTTPTGEGRNRSRTGGTVGDRAQPWSAGAHRGTRRAPRRTGRSRSGAFHPSRVARSRACRAGVDSALRRILERWHVPGTAHAGHDPYGGDVRAGGQIRAQYGGGMQALLRSAFPAAPARYCIERRLAEQCPGTRP